MGELVAEGKNGKSPVAVAFPVVENTLVVLSLE